MIISRRSTRNQTCERSWSARRNPPSPRNFSDIVADYVRKYRAAGRQESKYYSQAPSLAVAIDRAAGCCRQDGKRQSHQRRLSVRVLATAKESLKSATSELRRCHSFDELLTEVRKQIGRWKSIGPLAVYDIAVRVGWYLKLEPKIIYLHAGTTEGAKVLGLDCRRKFVTVEDLPREFVRLRPGEIEDCLCIYREELRSIAGEFLRRSELPQ